MYRSHRTADMLNYFDLKDSRVREQPYTIDAQLLNLAAMQLDDLELRGARELSSRTLATCPSHLDNRGLYHAVRIPPDVSVPAEGQEAGWVVEGLREGVWSTLNPFDDRLPLPVNLVLDGSPRLMSDPVILDLAGSNGLVQTASPRDLVIPNRLTFWLDLPPGASGIDILLEGEPYPAAVWPSERGSVSERMSLSAGQNVSRRVWSSVSKISVRGLGTGARLRCFQLATGLPAVADLARPYFDPGYRDLAFPRYWSIHNQTHKLVEQYYAGRFGGLEYVQSYQLDSSMTGLAVEPQTWGLWLCSSTSLYYLDRREPLPELSRTGLTREPLWGISVSFAEDRSDSIRYVRLTPKQYAGSARALQYRYLMRDPDGDEFIILPSGALAEYAGSSGWMRDWPRPRVVPVTKTGSYEFTIECSDAQHAVYADVQPYMNLSLAPRFVKDMSAEIDNISGVAHDFLGRLWVWSGVSILPYRPAYDAYLLDRETASIYLTDYFESVRFSNA